VGKAKQENGLEIETDRGICIESDSEMMNMGVEYINTGSNLLVQFNVQTFGCN
jgi:hypothetical protein